MDRRALIVTYYFPPLGGGGVQRMAKLVKYASRKGWEFTVITADEPTGFINEDPSLADEVPASTKIIRVPFKVLSATPTRFSAFFKTSGFLKRLLSAFVYIPDSRKGWLSKAWPVIARELQGGQYDLVLVSIPPYSLSFLVSEIERRFDLPVILDMRDPWTLNPYKIYPTPLHRFIDQRMEREVISRIHFGISAYGRMLKVYRKTVPGFNPSNWLVIPNGFDEEDFDELSLPKEDSGTFDIAFSGTIYSHINHPTPLFKALALARKLNPQEAKKIRFVFVGKSHINLEKLIAKFGLQEQIILHEYLPHKESLSVLNKANALCFILDDRETRSAYTVGGKVYEYLAFRKPILGLAPEEGEAADLIRRTDAGIIISPQKSKQIADTILNWSKGNIPEFSFISIDEYQRKRQADRFLSFFEKVMANGPLYSRLDKPSQVK
ncbi:hypothetical protein DRI50_00555 [candidate division KSB1 bacterium]|nr:MAG: hypothetical protein DRI50_00555 [candidate division KSB1 bacterium]